MLRKLLRDLSEHHVLPSPLLILLLSFVSSGSTPVLFPGRTGILVQQLAVGFRASQSACAYPELREIGLGEKHLFGSPMRVLLVQMRSQI